MEAKFFLSSPTPSPPATAHLPLFLSHKSPLVKTPKFSVTSHLPLAEKTPFLGLGLELSERNPQLCNHPSRVRPPTRAALPKDNVIQQLKFVLNMKTILESRPDRTMSLMELDRHRRDLGVDQNQDLEALLKKSPSLFEILEEGGYVKMIPEAEEQPKVGNGMVRKLEESNVTEEVLVVKLRKLLMMSSERRILLARIRLLSTDLGLPWNFRDTICHKYPQFFKVVVTAKGLALELTHWDPELAVSAAEEKNMAMAKNESRDLPYVSPYSDFSKLKQGTLLREKHACGVVHEILSLTVGKTTLVNNLAHFRHYYGFSVRIRSMLTRHPELFCLSLAEEWEMQSVSLREASDRALVDAPKDGDVEERAAEGGRRRSRWSNPMSQSHEGLDDDMLLD